MVESFDEVGNLDLMVTNESGQFTPEERERMYGEGTYTSYEVPYRLAAPFFGIEQTPAYRYAEDIDAIQPAVGFNSSTGDSLSYARFQFKREVPEPGSDYASMTYGTYERIAAPIEEQFGEAALVVRYRDPEAGRTYPVGFWPGVPFSAIVTAREANTRAEFRRTTPQDINIMLLVRHFLYWHVPYVETSRLMPLTTNN
jgi:hypothetical protein